MLEHLRAVAYGIAMVNISLLRFLPLVFILLVGCQLDPGDPCETSGSGFTRTDPCSTQCVDWPVQCADGSTAVPGMCTDSSCTSDADCSTGWGCVQVNATDSACLLQIVCPGGFADSQLRLQSDSENVEPPPVEKVPDDGAGVHPAER